MPRIIAPPGSGAPTFTGDKTYSQIVAMEGSAQPGDQAQPTDLDEFRAISYAAGVWTWYYRNIEVCVPPTAGWSWVNQGAATINRSGPVERLDSPSSVGLDIHGYVRSTPVTPWTIRLWFFDVDGLGRSHGALLRESATGELYRFGWLTDPAAAHGSFVAFNTSPTAGTTVLKNQDRIDQSVNNTGPIGLEIEDDGVNLYFRYVTTSGVYLYYSEGRTTRMAGGPDQIGMHVAATGQSARLELLSWCES